MKAVKISDRDNVAVVVAATAKGDIIEGLDIRALADIPQGHKIALQPIKKDQPVIRYGVVLGYMKEDIPAGGWINENGEESREYTLVIYLSDTTLDEVHAAADDLLKTFNQSSVLIQTNPTQTEFYAG